MSGRAALLPRAVESRCAARSSPRSSSGGAFVDVDFGSWARNNDPVRRGRGGWWAAAWVVIALDACSPMQTARTPPPPPPSVASLAQAAPALDRAVLALALRASNCAVRRGLLAPFRLLTVVDYSRPSTEPRLWVFDLERGTLRFQTLVAHGCGSGELYATSFSNDVGSRQSSLGLFATGEIYDGRHGRSLRLQGLEPGLNDRAFERAIVMHGADYAGADFAAANGRLGRSHGCPALPLDVAPAVIDEIAGGTPFFAYHSDPSWREISRLLGACERAAGD